MKLPADSVRFARTDMLGRYTPLEFVRVLRIGSQDVQISTNEREVIEGLARQDIAAGNLPRAWKVVIQPGEGADLPAPVILKKGASFHVAFGTCGWMVIDVPANQLLAFFQAPPAEVLRAISAVLKLLKDLQ